MRLFTKCWSTQHRRRAWSPKVDPLDVPVRQSVSLCVPSGQPAHQMLHKQLRGQFISPDVPMRIIRLVEPGFRRDGAEIAKNVEKVDVVFFQSRRETPVRQRKVEG